ncbi:MAG: hypothetical protein K6E74_02695 [Bacilli bacterium]|nr:hypothetical protein [Bacilli bacterium]
MNIVKKALFEKAVTSSKDNTDLYFEQSIYSTDTIGGSAIFDYLDYNSSLSMNEYLQSVNTELVSNESYRSKLFNTVNDKEKYASLINSIMNMSFDMTEEEKNEIVSAMGEYIGLEDTNIATKYETSFEFAGDGTVVNDYSYTFGYTFNGIMKTNAVSGYDHYIICSRPDGSSGTCSIEFSTNGTNYTTYTNNINDNYIRIPSNRVTSDYIYLRSTNGILIYDIVYNTTDDIYIHPSDQVIFNDGNTIYSSQNNQTQRGYISVSLLRKTAIDSAISESGYSTSLDYDVYVNALVVNSTTVANRYIAVNVNTNPISNNRNKTFANPGNNLPYYISQKTFNANDYAFYSIGYNSYGYSDYYQNLIDTISENTDGSIIKVRDDNHNPVSIKYDNGDGQEINISTIYSGNNKNKQYYLNFYQVSPGNNITIDGTSYATYDSYAWPEVCPKVVSYTIKLYDAPISNQLNPLNNVGTHIDTSGGTSLEDVVSYLASSANLGDNLDQFLIDTLRYLAPTAYSDYTTSHKYTDVTPNITITSVLKELVDTMTAEQKEEFYRRLITSSSENMITFLNALNASSSNYQELLNHFASRDYRYVQSIISAIGVNNIKNDETMLKAICAAYVVANYTDIENRSEQYSNVNLSQTTFKSLLDAVNNSASGQASDGTNYNGNVNFINSDGSINNDKFDYLLEYLELGQNDYGYGIYALSSSEGIKNGTFIPDNLVLSSLDANYEKDDSGIIYLRDEGEEVNGSSWRGGTDENNNDSSDTDSVNYHVLVEMKQLILSISTSLFELDLAYDDVVLYSSESQIDLDNNVVTYFLPKDYVSALNAMSEINLHTSVVNPTVANNAIYQTNNGDQTTISLANKSYDGTNYTLTVADAFTVIAEDRTVRANYKLEFIGIDISYDMEYNTASASNIVYNDTISATSATVDYTGGTIVLNVTSPASGQDDEKLPESLDLKRFIYLVNEEYLTEHVSDELYTITALDNNAIVGSDGSSFIQIEISPNLSYGTYRLYIDVYGVNASNNAYLTLIKNASSECNLEIFDYDGTNYAEQFTLNNGVYELTSYISFGTAYDYDELSNYTYLESIEYSEHASLDVTATKAESDGIMTYTVTYTITAEDGVSNKVYKHYLVEKEPFKTYINNVPQDSVYSYATIYKDGTSNGTYSYDVPGANVMTIIDTNGSVKAVVSYTITNNIISSASATDASGSINYSVTLASTGLALDVKNGNELICSLENIDVTSINEVSQVVAANAYCGEDKDEATMIAKDTSNNIYVSYPRGEEPSYRIKYVLSNLYTENQRGDTDEITYSINDTNEYGDFPEATLEIASAGFFATLAYDNDAGTYKYSYHYEHSGIWENGEEYTRSFDLPYLVISKTYSMDALLHGITFLESYKTIGNTATAVLPGIVMYPSEQDTSLSSYNANDQLYSDVFNLNYPKPITLDDDDDTLTYSTNNALFGDSSAYDDYYVVGTVSRADLQDYAPIFNIEDNAEIYKSTSLCILNTYGADNNQSATDEEILENHSSTYTNGGEEYENINFIYVPFYTEYDIIEEQEVFMVAIDESGYWKGIYSLGASKLIDITDKIDTRSAKSYAGFEINGSTYHVSQYAGSTSTNYNSSIYMDYIGAPLDNHFNYVSYMIMSESYLKNTPTSGTNNGSIKYYHVALIDTSNNVYFDCIVYAPTDFMDNVYLTIAENIYTENTKTQKSISFFAIDSHQVSSGENTQGMKKYELMKSLSILSSGYFYFYVDLPSGYKVSYVILNKKANQISTSTYQFENPGAYVAPYSIVAQTIKVAIVIEETNEGESNAWAVKTSDTYTVQAKQINWDGAVSDENPDY